MYSCGQSSVSVWGSIHGCIAPGISRAPRSASSALARRTLAWNSGTSPDSEGAGPFVFSSRTCSVSSFDQATGPNSTSDSAAPATRSISVSHSERTDSVSASTIIASISTP